MPVIAPRPQLLTYPDSLGGTLASVADLLDGPLAGLFSGVHVLPPFPSSGDRGFAPVTYEEIDPRFGTWVDIERIASNHDVMLDVMINHLSRGSPEFATSSVGAARPHRPTCSSPSTRSGRPVRRRPRMSRRSFCGAPTRPS